MKHLISGFMITKDVIKQGYPFIEAIAAALPICNEFLISDGYSTDGTYEVLKKISATNPKIKISQNHWPNRKDAGVLSEVTNQVRSKCRYNYILSVQANEIIHQDSAPLIRALPEMFPSVETFSFPFIQFLNTYKFAEGYRLRFAKNRPEIVAKGDSWTLGASDKFIKNKILRGFAHPRRVIYYLKKGVEFVHANPCFDYRSRAVYLPNPIFRYWALFPKNFVEKARKHAEIFPINKFRKPYDELTANLDNPEVFWKLGAKFLEFSKDEHYPEEFSTLEKEMHPAVIQKFLQNQNDKEYYVREELLNKIKSL